MEKPDDFYPLQMFVHHRYALPQENEISEEAAKALALSEGAKVLGKNESELASWKPWRIFSRDADSRPVWRMVLSGKITEQGFWKAALWLDGITGDILFADTSAPDGRNEL